MGLLASWIFCAAGQPPLGQRLPSGHAELLVLLGSFFCISSLRGGVAFGVELTKVLILFLSGAQGEPREGPGCCLTFTPCGEAKGSHHPHFSTIRLLAKVSLTAPPSKLPSPKPAT